MRLRMNLNQELDFALELARQAGKLLLTFYESPSTVEWKEHSEPVTAADKAANALIVERIATEFPEDGLLAEETPDSSGRLAHERLWVIDPMDGTKEFI